MTEWWEEKDMDDDVYSKTEKVTTELVSKRGEREREDVRVSISMDIGSHIGAKEKTKTLAATYIICWR